MTQRTSSSSAAASLWEIAIGLKRANFRADAALFRRSLLNDNYQELAVTGEHTTVARISRHRDPFDRLLIAQSILEGITADSDPPVAHMMRRCDASKREMM